jgi:ankyrin repeat protein
MLSNISENIFEMCRAGDVNHLRSAISQNPEIVNTVDDSWSSSPLMMAAQAGHLELVELLIEAGANVNAQNDCNSTALMFASRCGHISVVRTLLAAGANVNVQHITGKTPLAYALHEYSHSEGYNEIIEELIRAYPTVDTVDAKYGSSPLMFVCEARNVSAAKLLLELGANVNARNNFESTALMFAAKSDALQLVNLLLHAGADVNAMNCRHESALYYAAIVDAHDTVQALLKAGTSRCCALKVPIFGLHRYVHNYMTVREYAREYDLVNDLVDTVTEFL